MPAVFAPVLVDEESSELDDKREGTRRSANSFSTCHVSGPGISRFMIPEYLIAME